MSSTRDRGFPAEPVSLRNFHRFYPLADYFGRKVLNKFRGRLGFQHSAGHSRIASPRLRLWRDERVEELLRPANMKLSGWMDPVALENFLERSRGENFQLSGQWGRLLSLECALRVATQQRQKYSAQLLT